MTKKIIQTSLALGLFLSPMLYASNSYVPNLNQELKYNESMIKEYTQRIKKLTERNKFLADAKTKNPKLYESKPLFEETKTDYIQRIKLGGAEAKNINFKIEKHMIEIQMNIKMTREDKEGYFESSRSFYQRYSIPENVQESKITHYIDGDYFVIKMPKE